MYAYAILQFKVSWMEGRTDGGNQSTPWATTRKEKADPEHEMEVQTFESADLSYAYRFTHSFSK